MIIDAHSEKGKRETNQDAYLTGTVNGGVMNVSMFHHNSLEEFEVNTSLEDGTVLLIVADGMGGLEDGERASYLTLIKFIDYLEDNNDPTLELDEVIEDSLLQLSRDVAQGAPGAGSTIVGALITEGTTTVFHVGDSKCIAHVNGEFICTKDHVYGEELKSNIITDYIGMEGNPDVRIEFYPTVADNLILFSDGLNPAYISRGTQICASAESAKDLCNEAIELGSEDNTTCVKYGV